MKLEDFRTTVAVLIQRQLADLSNLATSTIQQIEAGKPFSKLTRGKVLSGLGKHLGRRVAIDEIDEFKSSD